MAINLGVLQQQLGSIGRNMAPQLDMQGAAQGYLSTLGAIQQPLGQQIIGAELAGGAPRRTELARGMSMINPGAALDYWQEMERNDALRARQQGETAAQSQADLRARAADMIPATNEAARRLRAAANQLVSAETEEAKQAALDAAKDARADYDAGIKQIAAVPGMWSYVEAKLSTEEDLAVTDAIKRADLQLRQFRASNAPQIAENEEERLRLAQDNLSLARQKEERAQKEASYGTEGERTAKGYLDVALEAEKDIRPIPRADYQKLLNVGGTVAAMVKWAIANRASLSQEANASIVWVDNLLRSESGAAIGESESANFISNYIPVADEPADKVVQKNRLRSVKLGAMKTKAGRLGEGVNIPTGPKVTKKITSIEDL